MSQADKKQNSNGAIENAAEVIERFGGIRPMAKKIDVAVTTIQGWKKRDVIPAARRGVILEAAAEHNVDLSDVMSDVPAANENAPKAEKIEETEEIVIDVVPESVKISELQKERAAPVDISANKRPLVEGLETAEGLEQRLAEVEKQVVGRNTWVVLALIVCVLAAVAALIWPLGGKDDGAQVDRLSALEQRTQELVGDVDEVKDQQSFFGTLIPKDLDQQLAGLKEQAEQVKEQAGAALEKAQEISNDVLSEGAGTIEQRAVKLETHLQEITGSPVLAGMLETLQGLSGQEDGQVQISQSLSEIMALMNGVDGQLSGQVGTPFSIADERGALAGSFETTLDVARARSDALGQTFAGVPATELKAAAMLLAMTQFRSSLNRDSEAFGQDFEVLMGLVGQEDVELRSALELLAPQAQSGVLTPSGLSSEFKTIAGDAVVASLKGEDVSLGDKASARFHEILQVEKDGEVLTGTPTQAAVSQAESLLDAGDITGAIGVLRTLDGPAGQVLSQWIGKAEATLKAQSVMEALTRNINLKAYGDIGGDLGGAVPAISRAIEGAVNGAGTIDQYIPPVQ